MRTTLFFLLSVIFFTLVSSGRIVTYIDSMNSWWPPEKIAAGMGVPGYGVNNSYNVVNFAFWTTGGSVDIALVWEKLFTYVSADNPWGKSNAEVQTAWRNIYHAHNVKVLVSAFGSTDFPTSRGVDPVACGQQLAKFVKDNNLDGVDLDWEDNDAMNQGKGEAWLVAITKTLRSLLPKDQGYIISHAPQAPYFMGAPKYPNGGYLTVHAAVGDLIDFYNVQFYNQGTTAYATYSTLFQKSEGWATGTSVLEMAAKGIDKSKIVIGKPVTQGDVNNSGFISLSALKAILQQAAGQWNAGVMGWQYKSDADGSWSNQLASVIRVK